MTTSFYDQWTAHRHSFVGPRPARLDEDRDHPEFTRVDIVGYDFGVRDEKGRRVGCNTAVCKRVYKVVEGHDLTGTDGRSFKPGVVYHCWLGNSTRSGESFGACQSWHYCESQSERQAQLDKYLRDAEKRAVKKFGPKIPAI